MANFLKNILGGSSSSVPSAAPSTDDSDFADFAGAPDPSPASITAATAASDGGIASSPTARGLPTGLAAFLAPPQYSSNSRPYTKWYRVWERTSVADFYQELFLMPVLLIVVFVHFWGTRANRRRAKQWMSAHAPVLQQEYALVGFEGRNASSANDFNSSELVNPEELLKEKTANEWTSYATGRQNVAFTDIKLSLLKRYNPLLMFGENALAFFFESMPATQERLEVTSYVFDGKEKQLIPRLNTEKDEDRKPIGNSNYDGFVWAIVHKDAVNRLKKERYDLSLASAKEHAKLSNWLMVLSESAEITEALLTNDLVKAVSEAGDALESIIVTDQPVDQPKSLNDCMPRKRINLVMKLPSSAAGYQSTLPLFRYFVRMPDHLVASGRFRSEAMRRVRQTREDEVRKIKREVEKEREEEKKAEGDKGKKEKRDALLKNMSAEEQRKYLEKEREKDMRKSSKKRTIKG